MGDAPLWIAIVVLLILSAFFSSMETAYSCANKLKLKTMIANGNKRAEKVLRLAENFDSLISTILVGNNIVNITNASLAGLLFASMISDAGLAATISTIVTTVAVLIFGEITPKMIAKVYPERFAIGEDLLLWPVYVCWTKEEWERGGKIEYARQANLCCENALYINSICDGDAFGGAAHFFGGMTQKELPVFKEGLLYVEI